MQKKRLFMIIFFVSVSLIIVGCRVRSASQGDPQEPTQVRDQLASDISSPTAETFDSSASATATIPVIPTETFTPVVSPTQEGAVVASPTTEVIDTASEVPTDFASQTPFATSTFTVTPFPTDTPTFTPTFTPSITPSPTNSPFPTDTPLPSATFTFTPFPSLTPLPPTAIGQIGTELPPQQQTATAAVATFWATLGTYIPTSDTGQGGVVATDPAQFIPSATPTVQGYPDCEVIIRLGETLSEIARQYNMSSETLGNYNDITNIDLIKAGDTLVIPGCGQNPTPVPTATIDTTTANPQYDNSLGPISYTVVQGDNIYRLSVTFGVTMQQILQANGIAESEMNFIYEGDVLNIPMRTQSGDTVATPTTAPINNTAPSFPTATPTAIPALPAG